MKKILVTYQLPKEGLKDLFEMFDVTYPEKQVLDQDDLKKVISEYDGVLAAGIKMDDGLISAAKKLKIISNYGVGYDKIDVESATRHNVVVANTPRSVTEATAEIAFGLMISVMRRISECDRRLRQPGNLKWGMMNNLGHTLYGKTLGIVGLGRIGEAVARRALASGMKIVYHNRKRLQQADEIRLGAVYLDLDRLMAQADVISVHVPLAPESYHLIGKRELELMKPSAFIINTARGAVIDEEALISYLEKNRIAGAGLDVFENEPYIPEALLRLDNVVLTPHIGTEAIESRVDMAVEASRNIIDYFTTGKTCNIVNPEVYDR